MARSRFTRILLWIATALIGPPLLYVAAAFVFALMTPPRPLPAEGIPVYACDNGVHADLVLPVRAAGIDWRATFKPAFFSAPLDGLDHLGFGWGSRDFYLQTPHWADFSPRLAMKALLWDDTVLHVEYRPRPVAGEDCRAWRVDEAAYREIVTFVRAGLAGDDSAPRLDAAGYGARDGFFTANGRYTLIGTCNQWTGQALRAGGAPVAPWTPFSFLVLWRLPPIRS